METGFCLALLHGSLGCYTCDLGGEFHIPAKTKKHRSRRQGEAKTTQNSDQENHGAKPLWKVKRSILVDLVPRVHGD